MLPVTAGSLRDRARILTSGRHTFLGRRWHWHPLVSVCFPDVKVDGLQHRGVAQGGLEADADVISLRGLV